MYAISPNFSRPILISLQAIASTRTHQLRRRWVQLLVVAHTKLSYDCAASCVDASSARCRAGGLCPLYRHVFMLGLAMSVIFSECHRLHVYIADQNHVVVHTMQSISWSLPYNAVVWRVMPDYAINNHLTPFISMQNHYNLVYREEEREMFPTLKVGFSFRGV